MRVRVLNGWVAAVLCLLCLGARAADAPPDPARLKSLETDLQQTTSERDRLKAQSATVGRALDALRAQTIDLAREIQDQERSLTLMDTRIAELTRNGDAMSKTLKDRDAQMGAVLLALERLALHPGDALALNPLSPDDAIRSAILLRSALPHIQQSQASLQKELADLYKVRAETAAAKQTAAGAAAALNAKRAQLETLEREKSAQQLALADRSTALDQRVAEMAQQAKDLRDLFAKLAEEKARREGEAQAPEPEGGQKPAERKTPESKPAETKTAKANPNHDGAVTRPFSAARGAMTFPVAGTVTGKYGEAGTNAEDPGVRAKGITITTRPGAAVVAPYDGIVAFAGPFRGYGQLLIIEHSEGYHTLLAGLGRIDAAVGQHILAGEPVGVMENDGAPSLYVELRRDGQPINPLPWLADRAGKSG
jgi:septal ring factor EnvC (AmiA/AmiB activator)